MFIEIFFHSKSIFYTIKSLRSLRKKLLIIRLAILRRFRGETSNVLENKGCIINNLFY